jgi:hypothetical protein
LRKGSKAGDSSNSNKRRVKIRLFVFPATTYFTRDCRDSSLFELKTTPRDGSKQEYKGRTDQSAKSDLHRVCGYDEAHHISAAVDCLQPNANHQAHFLPGAIRCQRSTQTPNPSMGAQGIYGREVIGLGEVSGLSVTSKTYSPLKDQTMAEVIAIADPPKTRQSDTLQEGGQAATACSRPECHNEPP